MKKNKKNFALKLIGLLNSESGALLLMESYGWDPDICELGIHLLRSQDTILKVMKATDYNPKVCLEGFYGLEMESQIIKVIFDSGERVEVYEVAFEFFENLKKGEKGRKRN